MTPLSARTFGTWTLLSAVVRLYAALDIHNPTLYKLALVSYYLAFGHFVSEVAVYKTAGKGALSPFIVSCKSLPIRGNFEWRLTDTRSTATSIVWMHTQWAYYVR